MKIGNLIKKQNNKVVLDTQNFNNMVSVVNQLRNINFDKHYFRESNDSSGMSISLNKNAILEGVETKEPFFNISSYKEHFGETLAIAEDAYRYIRVKDGLWKFGADVEQSITVTQYNDAPKFDFETPALDPTLEDDYAGTQALLNIDRTLPFETVSQKEYILKVMNNTTEWIWLEIVQYVDGDPLELVEINPSGNCIRLNHGDTRPDTQDGVIVLGMIKNLNQILWIHQENSGYQLTGDGEAKKSFGYKLYKESGVWYVKIYNGYLTIHGVNEYFSEETVLQITGSPVYVYVTMPRDGGTPSIAFSNERVMTTLSEYRLNLYEFVKEADNNYHLTKIRNGGRDYNCDTVFR